MSAARIKVKTRHGYLYVNVSLKGTVCPQKRIIGIFIYLAYKMPDEAAFMSAVLLCVQLLPGEPLYFCRS